MQYEAASKIINDVAAEVASIPAATDPYGTSDAVFFQLRTLLNSCGQELVSYYNWQKLTARHSVTTVVPPDTGDYPLPLDFERMIDQTGWTPVNPGLGLPLGGPLSPQDWAYLTNTNLASSTIYISFRMEDNMLRILPQPPPNNVNINFEYISSWWVAVAAAPTIRAKNSCTQSDDVVLFNPLMMKKFLKMRFLEAKGFDTTAVAQQFNTVFQSITGTDVPGQILNMARCRVFPYLGWRNIPETNYGLP